MILHVRNITVKLNYIALMGTNERGNCVEIVGLKKRSELCAVVCRYDIVLWRQVSCLIGSLAFCRHVCILGFLSLQLSLFLRSKLTSFVLLISQDLKVFHFDLIGRKRKTTANYHFLRYFESHNSIDDGIIFFLKGKFVLSFGNLYLKVVRCAMFHDANMLPINQHCDIISAEEKILLTSNIQIDSVFHFNRLNGLGWLRRSVLNDLCRRFFSKTLIPIPIVPRTSRQAPSNT